MKRHAAHDPRQVPGLVGRGRRLQRLPGRREGETAVVVDCGNGAFGKLRERISYAEVDAVVISHLHGDHVLDLVPFSYALKFGPEGREPG